MNSIRIREYHLEDWLGLYLDGELIYEGDYVGTEMIARIINQNLPLKELDYNREWIDEYWEEFTDFFGDAFPEREFVLLKFLETLNDNEDL